MPRPRTLTPSASAGGWFTRFYRNSRTWGEAFAPAFRKFADDETEASALYAFEHALLPGLLQTEDYDRAALPNVTIQVLPSGIHVGLQGSFIIAEMRGTPTSVFVEDATDGRTADDAATVNGLSVRFRYLQTEAMTTAASRDFILKVAEDRWNA